VLHGAAEGAMDVPYRMRQRSRRLAISTKSRINQDASMVAISTGWLPASSRTRCLSEERRLPSNSAIGRAKITASYHTHVDVPGHDANDFSTQDKVIVQIAGIDSLPRYPER